MTDGPISVTLVDDEIDIALDAVGIALAALSASVPPGQPATMQMKALEMLQTKLMNARGT